MGHEYRFHTLLTVGFSRTGLPGIKANLKAVQGDLFFLEKYIFFVSKAPTLIELSDVHQVVFSRVGTGMGATAARTFDLKIITKSGPEFTFSSINKEEHETTESFLKEKKIKLKNEMVADADLIMAAAGADDDESMGSASSDDEGPRKKVPHGSEDDSETDGES
jgi:structure-specific recognition protein 1